MLKEVGKVVIPLSGNTFNSEYDSSTGTWSGSYYVEDLPRMGDPVKLTCVKNGETLFDDFLYAVSTFSLLYGPSYYTTYVTDNDTPPAKLLATVAPLGYAVKQDPETGAPTEEWDRHTCKVPTIEIQTAEAADSEITLTFYTEVADTLKLQTKEVTLFESAEILPDNGFDGMSSVNVTISQPEPPKPVYDLTIVEYESLGGRYELTQEQLNALVYKSKMYLAKLKESFIIKYPDQFDMKVLYTAMADVCQDNLTIAGQGGEGTYSRISAGNYSETKRRSDTTAISRRDGSAGGLELNLLSCVQKYAILYRKRICQEW